MLVKMGNLPQIGVKIKNLSNHHPVMVVPTAFFPHFGLPFSEAQGLLEVLDDDLAFLLGWVGGFGYPGHRSAMLETRWRNASAQHKLRHGNARTSYASKV